MSKILPPSRLTDVLRRNSMETLKKHAAELAAASSLMPAEAMQTRFLRNHFLVSPKALHLLVDELTLSRYQVFAVYKPPFCPMRRAEAHENYHRVSVESFIGAALKSQCVLPVLTKTLDPSEVRVRVLNDVDAFASGPVLVSVADRHPHATLLDGFTFEYDVVVAGHILRTTTAGGAGPQAIAVERLYRDVAGTSAPKGQDGAAAGESRAEGAEGAEGAPAAARPSACQCTFEVVQHGYYAVHPVSVLNIKITAPPSPLPPSIEAFVRDTLDTCVIGDPVAMGEFMAMSTGSGANTRAAGMREAVKDTESPLLRSHVVSMRGDCDFPRVFTHLREVYFSVPVLDVNGEVIDTRKVEFHCRKCFDSIIHRNRSFNLKSSRINLLDGAWAPANEYM